MTKVATDDLYQKKLRQFIDKKSKGVKNMNTTREADPRFAYDKE